MKFWNLKLLIELAASGFTLAGIFIGSTTAMGATCYLVALIFWFWMMHRENMWGLLPLNGATLVIASYNLWNSFNV